MKHRVKYANENGYSDSVIECSCLRSFKRMELREAIDDFVEHVLRENEHEAQ